MKLKTLTPAQKLIHGSIMLHLRNFGTAPAFQDIADDTGRAISTIHKHVRNLVGLGLLKQSIAGKIVVVKADHCPTCGHRKTNQDVSLEARKLGSKVLEILDDEEMPPKLTSERLQEVIAEALREARA